MLCASLDQLAVCMFVCVPVCLSVCLVSFPGKILQPIGSRPGLAINIGAHHSAPISY